MRRTTIKDKRTFGATRFGRRESRRKDFPEQKTPGKTTWLHGPNELNIPRNCSRRTLMEKTPSTLSATSMEDQLVRAGDIKDGGRVVQLQTTGPAAARTIGVGPIGPTE